MRMLLSCSRAGTTFAAAFSYCQPGRAMDTDFVGKLIKNHPFFETNMEDFLGYEGEVIAKNPMTDMMVNYLRMDDEELAKFSGHTTPQDYKHKIMLSIVYFWD